MGYRSPLSPLDCYMFYRASLRYRLVGRMEEEGKRRHAGSGLQHCSEIPTPCDPHQSGAKDSDLALPNFPLLPTP